MSLLMQWNDALFQARNSHAGAYPWLDALMVWCANALIFCFLLVMLLMWGRPLNWRKQQLSAREQEILRERRAAVLWVAIACLAADAFNMVVEHLMFEPRPFISQHVHLLISHVADDSFPSDHTA
jgi:undecaprenyl-diphosphatase